MADKEYLDTQEQEELICSLQRSNTVQNRLWRGLFSVLAAGLALFFLRSALLQAYAPWQRRYHAAFHGILSQGAVTAADLCTAGAMLGGGVALQSRGWPVLHQIVITCALLLSISTSLFWLGMLRISGSGHYFWLPMAPTFGALCVYVDRSLYGTTLEINRLRASKYRFKKA